MQLRIKEMVDVTAMWKGGQVAVDWDDDQETVYEAARARYRRPPAPCPTPRTHPAMTFVAAVGLPT